MTYLTELLSWLGGHVALVVKSSLVWLISLVVTVVAVRYDLIWIAPDHFARDHKPFDMWRGSHPVLRWSLIVVKNLIGAILVVAGLVMIVAPGPGWLALLMGLACVDLPGKRALERRIVARPTILAVINRIRHHAGRPPLELTATPAGTPPPPAKSQAANSPSTN